MLKLDAQRRIYPGLAGCNRVQRALYPHRRSRRSRGAQHDGADGGQYAMKSAKGKSRRWRDGDSKSEKASARGYRALAWCRMRGCSDGAGVACAASKTRDGAVLLTTAYAFASTRKPVFVLFSPRLVKATFQPCRGYHAHPRGHWLSR